MHNVIYQIFHPWHWLTYGQNASGVAAVAACLGLIGLFIYTIYTGRMMRLGESSRRAAITPVLISQGGAEFTATNYSLPPANELSLTPPLANEYRADLSIRNIGEGAAIFLTAWSQPVADQFDLHDESLLIRASGATQGDSELTELLRGERTKVSFTGFKTEHLQRRWLFVIDAVDHSNGKHQLRILRSGLPSGETIVSMVHSRDDSFGKRFAMFIKRRVGILRAIQ